MRPLSLKGSARLSCRIRRASGRLRLKPQRPQALVFLASSFFSTPSNFLLPAVRSLRLELQGLNFGASPC